MVRIVATVVASVVVGGAAFGADPAIHHDGHTRGTSLYEATGHQAAHQQGQCDLPGCTVCATCCERPQWFARAEAIWLKRTRSRPFSLSVEDSPERDDIILDTDDLKFDYEPGFRILVGRHLDECTSLEASYFTLQSWDEEASTAFSPDGDIDPYWGNDVEDIDLRNFSGAFQHVAHYRSELDNFELNLRRHRSANHSVLLGFRYVRVDEEFGLLSYDSDNQIIALNPNDTGLYEIETDNHLFGLQLGGERRWSVRNDRLQFGVRGKAGVFVNFLEQESGLLDINRANMPARRTSLETEAEDAAFSTLVELGLFATYAVSDHIAVRGGYDVMFVNGLALAPEQLDIPQWQNARDFLSDNGNIVYHGPSGGVEVSW